MIRRGVGRIGRPGVLTAARASADADSTPPLAASFVPRQPPASPARPAYVVLLPEPSPVLEEVIARLEQLGATRGRALLTEDDFGESHARFIRG